ncbi:uncharacterized protein G2W53_035750 [Senna tora]|uniref:Uncharacterized protein n=1 Tax=Senna tora TaxID=362788 RepID=A0A834SSA9_9FABA|nr:uncharacterized protein G2W53_035750 [Senna tora]
MKVLGSEIDLFQLSMFPDVLHALLGYLIDLICSLPMVFRALQNITNDQATGELAFCHPNIDLEPESQSFEFNDNNPDSTECKSRNQKPKEDEKRLSFDLKCNEENLVSTQNVIEAEDDLIASKLVSHMSIIDMENDDGASIKNFVKPVSDSSQDTEFSNAERFPNVSILDLSEELDSSENSEDNYMDEYVTEREPELIVCYKGSNYHYIKDICVDEGALGQDKVLFENSVDEKAVFKFLSIDTYENKESKKDNIGINALFQGVLDLAVTEDSDMDPAKNHQSEDLMQREEIATEKLDGQNKEMVLSGNTISSQEINTEKTGHSLDGDNEIELNHAKVSADLESHYKHEESKNRIEEAELASPAIDKPNSDILVSDIKFVPLDSVAACSKEECHQVDGSKRDDTQITSKPEEGRSNDQAITSQVSHSLGESSFSAVECSLNGIAAQSEWQNLTGGIPGSTGDGGFFAANSEFFFSFR